MKNETDITDYSSFLKAKELLNAQLDFHRTAIKLNLKEGVKALAIIKLISVTINRFYRLNFIKKIKDLFYLKSFSKDAIKSWLNNFMLHRKSSAPSFSDN